MMRSVRLDLAVFRMRIHEKYGAFSVVTFTCIHTINIISPELPIFLQLYPRHDANLGSIGFLSTSQFRYESPIEHVRCAHGPSVQYSLCYFYRYIHGARIVAVRYSMTDLPVF